MEICNTAPIKIYRQLPELIKFNSRIVIREAAICDNTAEDIKWLRKLNKEIILWFDEYLPKNEILPIAGEFGSKKIMCPITTLQDIDSIENVFSMSDIKIIAIPNAQNERKYLTTIGKILKSRVIIGIGFDYTVMLTPFKQYALPEFATRPRVLEYINGLYGLSLYNKEIHCLKMTGALSEILLLSNFGYITSLVSDIALSCARSHIKMDDESFLPIDFNSEFTRKYRIDDPDIHYVITDQMHEIVLQNINAMREHNEQFC